jgi:hypothetical protein
MVDWVEDAGVEPWAWEGNHDAIDTVNDMGRARDASEALRNHPAMAGTFEKAVVNADGTPAMIWTDDGGVAQATESVPKTHAPRADWADMVEAYDDHIRYGPYMGNNIETAVGDSWSDDDRDIDHEGNALKFFGRPLRETRVLSRMGMSRQDDRRARITDRYYPYDPKSGKQGVREGDPYPEHLRERYYFYNGIPPRERYGNGGEEVEDQRKRYANREAMRDEDDAAWASRERERGAATLERLQAARENATMAIEDETSRTRERHDAQRQRRARVRYNRDGVA